MPLLDDLNAWLSDEHDQDDFQPDYLLIRRDDVRSYRDAVREAIDARESAPDLLSLLRGIGTDDDGDGYCTAEHMEKIAAILASVDGGAQ